MDNLDPTLENLDETDITSWKGTGGLWRLAINRLIRNRSSQLGIFLVGALVFIAIFAKQIAPYDPAQILIGVENVTMRGAPCIHLLGCPESEPQHIFGTDSLVRDFFSRVIYGTRISLLIGISTIGLAIMIGTILGAVAGYSGGWLDFSIMRIMDFMLAFPVMLLALVVVAMLGPSLLNTFIAITVVQIPQFARISRSSVLSLKKVEFVEASRALGGGYFHILFKRILPNSLTPLIIKGTLGVASAILDAAALSFLGFGPDRHTPEWGTMLGFERNSMFNAPHLVIFPGLAIMITALAFNLLGEGLRDSLDPRNQ
jgi:peptide/nickel transport system permease protein